MKDSWRLKVSKGYLGDFHSSSRIPKNSRNQSTPSMPVLFCVGAWRLFFSLKTNNSYWVQLMCKQPTPSLNNTEDEVPRGIISMTESFRHKKLIKRSSCIKLMIGGILSTIQDNFCLTTPTPSKEYLAANSRTSQTPFKEHLLGNSILSVCEDNNLSALILAVLTTNTT